MEVLHGEQVVQSRKQLLQTVDAAKQAGSEVIFLAAKDLNQATLEQALGSLSLFGAPRLVVIEELHSLPRSKKKDILLDTVATAAAHAAQATNASQLDIVLWEKRDLTATMLKKFPSAKVSHFKVSKHIFGLVEKLSPNQAIKPKVIVSLHQAIEGESDFFVFTMIIRQIRLLIEVKDGGKPAGPPFMVGKLKSQAEHFSLPQLLKLHGQLTAIDSKLKRSATPLSLTQELDLFIMNM